MKLGTEVGLGPDDIVLDGYPAPFPEKGGTVAPIFGPCLLCQTAGWIKMPLATHVLPRPRPHCVRWGPSSPPQKRGRAQFSPHVYCGQTAGWIKMPLGTDVGLDLGHVVLDGDSAPPRKGAQQLPLFGPCLL